MTSWFKGRLGRIRVSTAVLVVAFFALFWVQQTFQPEPAPEAPAPAVVPPGFVPDPNYTWVPRTYVRRPNEADTTTTTSPHDDRDDDAVGHHEPDVANVADPDDDGYRSGRSGWPAGAADPDADTGLGNADHGSAGTGNGARHAGGAEIARPAHADCTATLACRVDVLPGLKSGNSNPIPHRFRRQE